MSVSTANATELTQEQVAKILVQPLAEKSVFLAAGPRIFDTAGPLRIPKAGGPVDPDWTGENELITEKDVAFDEIQLLPSTMKSLKVITRYSNELARQSVVALDQAIKDRLVNGVADKLDAQLLSAGGDGVTTPKGLFAYSGIQTLAVGGALTGVDDDGYSIPRPRPDGLADGPKSRPRRPRGEGLRRQRQRSRDRRAGGTCGLRRCR